ncbi:MAG: hypothetical protein JJU10_03835, partial [Idiomarina sp.]|nr:hypothetical protein [Idiomarina sp.]
MRISYCRTQGAVHEILSIHQSHTPSLAVNTPRMLSIQMLAAQETMKLSFSHWYKWSSRNEYPGIAYPGIYVVAVSENDFFGQPFSLKDEVVYVGMSNAVAGLRGRLQQFDNTIAQKRCQHGGADRMLYKYQNYDSLVRKLYVSLWHVECSPALESAEDLRAMGTVCNAEYELMAQSVEKFGQLPEFNRQKE